MGLTIIDGVIHSFYFNVDTKLLDWLLSYSWILSNANKNSQLYYIPKLTSNYNYLQT